MGVAVSHIFHFSRMTSQLTPSRCLQGAGAGQSAMSKHRGLDNADHWGFGNTPGVDVAGSTRV